MIVKKRTVCIFLVNSKKELLLHLRDNKPSIVYPGYWSLIGGSIEKGESDLEAVKRETKEEIGYDVKDVEHVGYADFPKLNIRVRLFRADIDIDVKDINLTEGQRVEFFKISEISNLKISAPFRKFILENRDKIIKGE